jgi:ferredoxin-NADP reductase
MTGDASRFDLSVTEIRAETPLIRSIRLARADGEPLPSWEAGSHIKIKLPTGGERSFSLVNVSRDPAATTRPTSYLLGVRLETPSTGGSSFVHGLNQGDRVTVSAPSNNFRLEPSDKPVILVAGGIGITPIMSMAASLAASGHPHRFIYAGRSRDHFAFLPEIEALTGGKVELHTDDKSGIFDVLGLMRSLQDSEPLYLCGPKPMIEAAIAAAKALGWGDKRLHFELFTSPATLAGDQAFDVVLKSSGRKFSIPPGKTILDTLIEAGLDPLHDCKRGDCGICQVRVLEGVPDHRDYILSDAEKAEGKLMQICVSRSKTPQLVIDL